jgi:protease-4
MAGKKHPILMVLLILFVVVVFLGGAMFFVLKLAGPPSSLSFGEKIGVVTIEGTIMQSRDVALQIEKFSKDEGIKAILLRIDSPGGAIGPTQEIHREVQKAARKKKVIASLGGVAASGGYYIAAAADKVVANPGTLTGSIGTLMQFVRIEDLLEKLGIEMEVLKSGEFKDIGSPHRELTRRDREILEGVIREIQQQFVKAVAGGRNLPVEKVEAIADGRIFTGASAREMGLVDELGNFQDAVETARREASIKGDASLVYPRRKGGIWDSLFTTAMRSFISLLRESDMRAEYRWEGLSGAGLKESR